MATFCDVLQWGQFKRGKIAHKIHEFHGGMGTATYKVGSLIMAGKCVPQELLLDAAEEVSDIKGGRVLSNMLKGWARDAKVDEPLGSSKWAFCVRFDRLGRCLKWSDDWAPRAARGLGSHKRKAPLGNIGDVDGMGPCCVKRDRKGKCKLWAEKRFVFDGHLGGKCIPPKRRK